MFQKYHYIFKNVSAGLHAIYTLGVKDYKNNGL